MIQPIGRNPSLYVPHEFGRTKHCRDRKPLTLAQDVRPACLRFPDHRRFQRIESVLKRFRSAVCKKFSKEIHAGANPRLIHCGEVVAVFDSHYAVPQRMDASGFFPAVFILDFHLHPPLPLARNNNAHLFLKVLDRNRRLVPIILFAIGPSGNDRVERNNAKAALGGFSSPQCVPLVSTDRPRKPRTIHEEAIIVEPYCQGNPLSWPVTWPSTSWNRGVQDVFGSLHGKSGASLSFLYKILDHLLMGHRL